MSCKVRARGGILVYRLYWEGRESQEGTQLRDTPKNREKLEAKAKAISIDIKDKTFDYDHWFPNGSRRQSVDPPSPPPVAPKRIGEWAERTWLPRKVAPLVRATLAVTYRKHLVNHILPLFADLHFADVSCGVLDDFRTVLVAPVGSQPFPADPDYTDAPQDASDAFRRRLGGPVGVGKGLALKTATRHHRRHVSRALPRRAQARHRHR